MASASDTGGLFIGADDGTGCAAFTSQPRSDRHGGIEGREPLDAAAGKVEFHSVIAAWFLANCAWYSASLARIPSITCAGAFETKLSLPSWRSELAIYLLELLVVFLQAILLFVGRPGGFDKSSLRSKPEPPRGRDFQADIRQPLDGLHRHGAPQRQRTRKFHLAIDFVVSARLADGGHDFLQQLHFALGVRIV